MSDTPANDTRERKPTDGDGRRHRRRRLLRSGGRGLGLRGPSDLRSHELRGDGARVLADRAAARSADAGPRRHRAVARALLARTPSEGADRERARQPRVDLGRGARRVDGRGYRGLVLQADPARRARGAAHALEVAHQARHGESVARSRASRAARRSLSAEGDVQGPGPLDHRGRRGARALAAPRIRPAVPEGFHPARGTERAHRRGHGLRVPRRHGASARVVRARALHGARHESVGAVPLGPNSRIACWRWCAKTISILRW